RSRACCRGSLAAREAAPRRRRELDSGASPTISSGAASRAPRSRPRWRARSPSRSRPAIPTAAIPRPSPSCAWPSCSGGRRPECVGRGWAEVLVRGGERLVLVIDGLDEVEQAETGNRLPRFRPAELPVNVSILCAARPGDPNLDWLRVRGPRRLDLDEPRW